MWETGAGSFHRWEARGKVTVGVGGHERLISEPQARGRLRSYISRQGMSGDFGVDVVDGQCPKQNTSCLSLHFVSLGNLG